MKPSEFNFERTDFESRNEVVEWFLEGECVAKALVLDEQLEKLERFRAGDDSVVPKGIEDAADLVWMTARSIPRPAMPRKRIRRKLRKGER
jgi:hypothetical protein